MIMFDLLIEVRDCGRDTCYHFSDFTSEQEAVEYFNEHYRCVWQHPDSPILNGKYVVVESDD
jgi:hypothetical protein